MSYFLFDKFLIERLKVSEAHAPLGPTVDVSLPCAIRTFSSFVFIYYYHIDLILAMHLIKICLKHMAATLPGVDPRGSESRIFLRVGVNSSIVSLKQGV